MSTLFGTILAAVNETASEYPPDGEFLPFNYVPTGWVGITFLALFAVTTAGHLFQALFFRVTYMIPTLVLCGICELLGWAARYWGHVDPQSGDAFMMQICTTIIAPSFMTAAMFLILPKIVNELGMEYSHMVPRLYSVIFISVDVTALVIQAVGGAMASIAETPDDAERGGRIMLGGIIIQLVAVVVYSILGIEFVVRFSLDRPARPTVMNEQRKHKGWIDTPRGIIWMLVGLVIATAFIIIRSIYRTIELTDGWNGTIISTEKWFNWFDGAPIVVAMFTFDFLHPGYLLRNLESDNRLPVSKDSSTERVEMVRM
ncbi:unnamed protein product [Rhizoctonia solani]|nr:unnamed protein product [Rhizoctonia solani]